MGALGLLLVLAYWDRIQVKRHCTEIQFCMLRPVDDALNKTQTDKLFVYNRECGRPAFSSDISRRSRLVNGGSKWRHSFFPPTILPAPYTILTVCVPQASTQTLLFPPRSLLLGPQLLRCPLPSYLRHLNILQPHHLRFVNKHSIRPYPPQICNPHHPLGIVVYNVWAAESLAEDFVAGACAGGVEGCGEDAAGGLCKLQESGARREDGHG